MINEVENKVSLDKMTDLEAEKNSLEMMRYRANSLSYILGFVAIICSICAAFVGLNSMNAINVQVILKILMNIVILLGGFLCVEKAKSYSQQGCIGLIAFGGLCALRILWIPVILLVNNAKYQTALKNGDVDARKAAEKWLGLVVTGKDQTDVSVRWLPASAVFRATMMILFLVLAAAAFIASGIIGFKRSKKLYAYLDSVNVKE